MVHRAAEGKRAKAQGIDLPWNSLRVFRDEPKRSWTEQWASLVPCNLEAVGDITKCVLRTERVQPCKHGDPLLQLLQFGGGQLLGQLWLPDQQDLKHLVAR